MKTAIINIKPGQTVAYHGEPCIVLEHRADGTLLMAANAIEYKFGSGNNFAASALHMHLNANYLDTLTEGHPDEIITRTVDLTALNGSKEFGTCDCKVAPLTLDELRKYHGIIPKPESWEWSVTPWSTPCVDGDDTWVMGLYTDGNVSHNYCTHTLGSRPAFLIPSNYAVEDDSNPLEHYTLNALVAEIARRVNKE